MEMEREGDGERRRWREKEMERDSEMDGERDRRGGVLVYLVSKFTISPVARAKNEIDLDSKLFIFIVFNYELKS